MTNSAVYPAVKAPKKRSKNRRYKSFLNIRLEVVRETPVKYITCKSSNDVAEVFYKETLKYPNEFFKCIHFNSKNIIIGVETISVGSLTSSLVHPRDAFKGALINNSTSVIFFHNHPSGNPDPSKDDIEITNRLVSASDVLGIKILDHIIFGEEGTKKYFSFMDEGLLHY